MTAIYDLEGAPTIVTGAGKGIGHAVALRCAQSHGRLVLNDCDEAALNETVQRCAAIGAATVAVAGDIAAPGTADEIVNRCMTEFGTPRIVVNNAGITRQAPIGQLDDTAWDRVLEVNLTGPFRLLRACATPMIEAARSSGDSLRSNGKIINISSVDGLFGAANQTNYAASKSGLIGLTMSLAIEWARYRINVNAVAPGAVDTMMSEPLRTDERVLQKVLARIPLRRFATPEEIASAVMYLADSDSDYVTGQTLCACGGIRIAP